MEVCSKITDFEPIGDFYVLHTNNADIKLYFLTDEIIRVRASFDKEIAEESFVVATTAWEDR